MQEAGQKKRSGSDQRQRGRTVGFRVMPEEYQQVSALAARAELTVASYVRSRALAKPTTRATRKPAINFLALSTLQASLNKSGSNLNQIAKHLNRGDSIALSQIEAALAEHRQVLAAIITALGRDSR